MGYFIDHDLEQRTEGTTDLLQRNITYVQNTSFVKQLLRTSSQHILQLTDDSIINSLTLTSHG